MLLFLAGMVVGAMAGFLAFCMVAVNRKDD
jgi:hypothetical protein